MKEKISATSARPSHQYSASRMSEKASVVPTIRGSRK
jgi:hypothetical protein